MTETIQISLGDLSFTADVAGPEGGEAVLLLHGFPETRHMWRHQLAALASAGYRAIAPDQRGYSSGARPQGEAAYASELIAGDALGLMDALGHERFHLVGHDWGGQIAWLIAAGHPHCLVSLTVLSRPHPAAFARAMNDDPTQAERSRHHRAFRETEAIQRMRASGLQPLKAALAAQGVPAADAEVYMNALMEPGAIEGAMSWYRAGALAAEVGAVHVPTLYVWGSADATVGRFAAELTAEYMRGPYRFVAMEGAGHFLVDQFPDAISGLILENVRERRA